MVSTFTILALCLSLLGCLVFPIVLCIVFMRKNHPGALPLIMGIVVFIVFVLILEQLMHYVFLSAIPATKTLFGNNPWLFATYGALAAGIFEETGRFLAFTFFLKKKREWKHGITYGIGHGGIEAVLIAAPAVFSNLVYAFMINSDLFDSVAKSVPKASFDLMMQTKDALIAQPSWMFALGGFERVCAITIQIALSVLVLYAVAHKKYVFVGLAILLHAVLDFPAGLAQRGMVPLLAVEGIAAVFAVASLIFILKSRKLFTPK